MNIHAQIEINNWYEENIFVGNIFFDDVHIEYESTLNIHHNLKSKYFKKHKKENPNPSKIKDPKLIQIINSCLLS